MGSIVTSIPATSSTTTICGSFLPRSRATTDAAQMPTAVTASAASRRRRRARPRAPAR